MLYPLVVVKELSKMRVVMQVKVKKLLFSTKIV